MSRFFSQRGERERVSDNQKKDEKDKKEHTGQLLKREICIENVSHCD